MGVATNSQKSKNFFLKKLMKLKNLVKNWKCSVSKKFFKYFSKFKKWVSQRIKKNFSEKKKKNSKKNFFNKKIKIRKISVSEKI